MLCSPDAFNLCKQYYALYLLWKLSYFCSVWLIQHVHFLVLQKKICKSLPDQGLSCSIALGTVWKLVMFMSAHYSLCFLHNQVYFRVQRIWLAQVVQLQTYNPTCVQITSVRSLAVILYIAVSFASKRQKASFPPFWFGLV